MLLSIVIPVLNEADTLLTLLRECTAVGFTIVITGDRSALAARVAGAVARKYVLRLADRADYALAGISPGAIPGSMPPGRAVCAETGAEVQFAYLGADSTTAAQQRALAEVAGRVGRPEPGRAPFRIRPLPSRVTRASLDVDDPGMTLLGVGMAFGLYDAAFAALGRIEDPKLADVLLGEYAKLAPELQPLAIDLIMQREPWARKLLDAVLANKLPKGVLNANHLRKILESNDREALWAVEKAFGRIREERNPEREKVVAEMGVFFREHIGDPHRGQTVFRNLCAQCHTIYGEGGKVGPDITANGRASFEQLLSNVFDPSLVIGSGYEVTTVVTKDGRNLTGLIAEDNEQHVVVRLPGEGEETVPRNQVKYTRASKLSMMPEGIETLLDKKDLADLFAFLALDKPPTDASAKLVPGAPDIPQPKGGKSTSRLKIESSERRLVVRAQLPGQGDWIELATYVMETNSRPYLHPVHDASGRMVLTEDRPADHPWQHGIFTGFHRVNGFNYWKENEGQQRFVRLLDLNEASNRVSWRALVDLVAPNRSVVLEEEDTITIHAPESSDVYLIDFNVLLRAGESDANFGKFFVGGLVLFDDRLHVLLARSEFLFELQHDGMDSVQILRRRL